jgi:signal peptidase I
VSEMPWIERALRTYPRAWQDRYESEVLDVAGELMREKGGHQGRIALGLLVHAPQAWFFHRRSARSRPALAGAIVLALAGMGALVAAIAPANPAASAPFRVTSGAMAPALKLHEVVQVNHLASAQQIRSGQIVVFTMPANESCGGPAVKYVVKRVVGLPGQTISLSKGNVFVDGRLLKEPWLAASEQGITVPGPTGSAYNLARRFKVPSDSYYVLGDNRDDSCDSRYLGPIPRSLVYGVVAAHH